MTPLVDHVRRRIFYRVGRDFNDASYTYNLVFNQVWVITENKTWVQSLVVDKLRDDTY